MALRAMFPVAFEMSTLGQPSVTAVLCFLYKKTKCDEVCHVQITFDSVDNIYANLGEVNLLVMTHFSFMDNF